MSYGKTIKDIAFRETDGRHAKLKIRLKYDGLTQQKFFSSLITAYLERDERIMNFILELKEREGIHTVDKRKRVKKMYEKSIETETKFGLNKKEVESVFDIIAADEKL